MSAQAPRGSPHAIVHPKAAEQAIQVTRRRPRASLASFVEYLWLVRWQVPEPYRQQVVPQPRVHIAAEQRRLLVHGISRDKFDRTLQGTGHVLGAAFRPGGFRAFLRRSVGTVAGSVRPAADVLGVDDRSAAARILDGADDADMVAALEDYLDSVAPTADDMVEQVAAWVALAESDPSLTRAGELAERVGISLRTLQRLFTEYVGIGPKWVIQRYRILDAAAAAHSGTVVDWASLAHTLGFSDQAHLTRAFTTVIGTPPAAYTRDARTR